MNRRGFLGLLPGALVGGKAAAKEATEKLALGASGQSAALANVGYGTGGAPSIDGSWALKALKRVTSGVERERRHREWNVQRLDPDLAANRSMSLSARMLIQKDRDIERSMVNERTYLEGVIAGLWS